MGKKVVEFPFSVDNKTTNRIFFREVLRSPRQYLIENNKCQEAKLVLCGTAKHFIILVLIVTAIFTLPLVVFSCCFIINIKLRIIMREILNSIYYFKSLIHKYSGADSRNDVIELPQYRNNFESTYKIVETRQPFISNQTSKEYKNSRHQNWCKQVQTHDWKMDLLKLLVLHWHQIDAF